MIMMSVGGTQIYQFETSEDYYKALLDLKKTDYRSYMNDIELFYSNRIGVMPMPLPVPQEVIDDANKVPVVYRRFLMAAAVVLNDMDMFDSVRSYPRDNGIYEQGKVEYFYHRNKGEWRMMHEDLAQDYPYRKELYNFDTLWQTAKKLQDEYHKQNNQ